MNRKILISFLLLFFILYIYKRRKVEPFTSIISGKDWLEEIFDRRQIITIPSRLNHVKKFCKSFEIKPTIFKAILKNNVQHYNNPYKLKLGEIACALSQEQVLKDFINSNSSTLLMFEDDNIPFTDHIYSGSNVNLHHIKKYITNAVNMLPSDWDVLYMGRCWDNCSRNIKINKYLYKTHRTLCHHAIAFSRDGAIKVLESIVHPLSKPIDHVVAKLTTNGEIDSYATIIPIFYQNREKLSSTLGNYDSLPVCL